MRLVIKTFKWDEMVEGSLKKKGVAINWLVEFCAIWPICVLLLVHFFMDGFLRGFINWLVEFFRLQKGRPCELSEVMDWVSYVCNFDRLCGFIGVHKMGECEGCGKLGRMVPRDDFVDAYHFSLLVSPVVSVWDCIVRKIPICCSKIMVLYIYSFNDQMKYIILHFHYL